jgi:hypothetical protein
MPGYTNSDKEALITKVCDIADKIHEKLETDEMILPTITDVLKVHRLVSTVKSNYSQKFKHILNNIFIHEIKSIGKSNEALSDGPLMIANCEVIMGEPITQKSELINGTIDFENYTITTDTNKIIYLSEDINFEWISELLYLYDNDIIRSSVEFANPIYDEKDINMDIIFNNDLIKKLSICQIMIDADKLLKNIMYNDPYYKTIIPYLTNALKEFTYERTTRLYVKGINWEIVDNLLLIQEKSNITVKSVNTEINNKYLSETNIYRPDIKAIDKETLLDKLNNMEKNAKKFDLNYTEKYDSLTLLPENKPFLELWKLAKSITIFRVIYQYKLNIVNKKPITFIDELSDKIKLENMTINYDNTKPSYIPEEAYRSDKPNIKLGGVIITSLDKNEFKLVATEHKDIIGDFLRTMISCTSKILKTCVEKSTDFDKIPKIKNLLLQNEHFRLYIAKPTYANDILFDRYTGDYVDSFYDLSHRSDVVPLFIDIRKAIMQNTQVIATELLIKYIERILYTFENSHKFMAIILDNYRLMNKFIRNFIENLLINDFSDYMLENLYKQIKEPDELNDEFYKFRELIICSKEDQIEELCPKINDIIRKSYPKITEKFYNYVKSRFLDI